jgi:cell division protein FtsX
MRKRAGFLTARPASLGVVLAIAAFVVLAGVGCGHPGAGRKPTTKHEPVLYVTSHQVYFCTQKTCARAATATQMKEAERHASASSLTSKVRFVSSAELRRKHPDGLAGLGLIPPFPNSLWVIPKRDADAQQVANLFRHGDHAMGINKVSYNYAFR